VNVARVGVLAFIMVVTACGSGTGAAATTTAAAPSTSVSAAAPSVGLVGRWERVVRCQELVSDLSKAGLAPLAQYAWAGQTSSTGQSSFASGSAKPTLVHPCKGALPRTHSHFFTESGQFGSLDWLGGQVDDGSYRILNSDSFRIGSVTFHYRILGGDTLKLSPVLTKAMLRQALAHPQKFSDAGWAVSVAYPGNTWRRAPCDDWC
jgi:hypothetical protein